MSKRRRNKRRAKRGAARIAADELSRVAGELADEMARAAEEAWGDLLGGKPMMPEIHFDFPDLGIPDSYYDD